MFNKAVAQLSDLFRSMTPAARVTTGLLLTVVVVSLGYLFRYESSAADAYLMNGEPIPASLIPKMEAAFAKAHLDAYEVQGSRIRVPRGQQGTYMGALAEAKALPPNFGSFLQGSVEASNILDDPEVRKRRNQVAVQEELSLIIRSMAGIESASVMIDADSKTPFGEKPLKTASVAVKAAGSEPVSEDQVKSVRYLVGSAVAGLKPENVTVLDLNTGAASTGDMLNGGQTGENLYLTVKTRWERELKAKILAALRYIPNLTVEANVQLDREKFQRTTETTPTKGVPLSRSEKSSTHSREGSAPGGRPGVAANGGANTPQSLAGGGSKGTRDEEEESQTQETNLPGSQQVEKENVGLTPERATVAVGIPNSYFEDVWRRRNPPPAGQEAKAPDAAALEQIRTEVTASIQQSVAILLPTPTKGPIPDPTELVKVTSLPDIKPPDIPAPGFGPKALYWLTQYWTTLAMLGLGLVSLMVLRSGLRGAPGASEPAAVHAHAAAEPEPAANEPPEAAIARRLQRLSGGGPSLRDELSEIVQEDPDTAANILRSWIGNVS